MNVVYDIRKLNYLDLFPFVANPVVITLFTVIFHCWTFIYRQSFETVIWNSHLRQSFVSQFSITAHLNFIGSVPNYPSLIRQMFLGVNMSCSFVSFVLWFILALLNYANHKFCYTTFSRSILCCLSGCTHGRFMKLKWVSNYQILRLVSLGTRNFQTFDVQYIDMCIPPNYSVTYV